MKKNIIIMGLFIVILVLSIVLGMNMNKKCDVNVPIQEDNKYEVLETTDEMVQGLFDNITNGVGSPCGLTDYYFNNDKVSVDDIPTDVLFRIAVKQIVGDDYRINFSIDSVRAKINNTFGKKVQFTAQTYNITPSYKYNYDTATYEYQNDTGIAKVCNEGKNLTRIVKVIKYSNKIEINVRVIFVKNGKYYSDYAGSNELTDLDKVGSVVLESDSNMRQGSLYKIIFSKEKTNYIFSSSELIK